MAFNNFRFAGSAYFNIGMGFLPFSITHGDGTSTQECVTPTADRVRADVLDLVADPESGVVLSSDVVQLPNMIDYLAATWSEARAQLHCARGLKHNMHHCLSAKYDSASLHQFIRGICFNDEHLYYLMFSIVIALCMCLCLILWNI
jgi:hypothetical protein